eukprot:COSAG06_NODE_103_length_23904_cov_10.413401_5_plen_167_part_00
MSRRASRVAATGPGWLTWLPVAFNYDPRRPAVARTVPLCPRLCSSASLQHAPLNTLQLEPAALTIPLDGPRWLPLCPPGAASLQLELQAARVNMVLLHAAVLLTCASLRGALAEEEPHPIQTLVMMVPMAERKDNMDFIYSALLLTLSARGQGPACVSRQRWLALP